jgi:hypothetical protein
LNFLAFYLLKKQEYKKRFYYALDSKFFLKKNKIGYIKWRPTKNFELPNQLLLIFIWVSIALKRCGSELKILP